MMDCYFNTAKCFVGLGHLEGNEAREQLDRLFKPDIRVAVDSEYYVIGFELLTPLGAAVFLKRSNTRYGDILGVELDVVQKQMPGLTFETVEQETQTRK